MYSWWLAEVLAVEILVLAEVLAVIRQILL